VGVAAASAAWGGGELSLAPRMRLSPALPLAFLTGLVSRGASPKRAARTRDPLVSGAGDRNPADTSGAAGGGGDDFAELFRAHRSDVARVCRRMLGESGGQDAVNEIFLRAQRARESYDRDRPFRPWLLGVASHYCVDQLRRRAKESQLFAPEDLSEEGLAHPGPSPLRTLALAEQRREVLGAIDSLARKYRLPIVLRYYEELDYQAIAEILGITRPQVGMLLFRAKRQLRSALADRKSES